MEELAERFDAGSTGFNNPANLCHISAVSLPHIFLLPLRVGKKCNKVCRNKPLNENIILFHFQEQYCDQRTVSICWHTISLAISKISTRPFPPFRHSVLISTIPKLPVSHSAMFPQGWKVICCNKTERTGWFTSMSFRYMFIKESFIL